MRNNFKELNKRLDEREEEIERLNNIIKNGINEELIKELDEILKCNQKQANRIDKAIEYIEEHIIEDSEYENYMQCEREEKEELLEILKGE